MSKQHAQPQLHQVLAVEGDLQGKAQKIIEETVKTFNDKQHLFHGGIKRYKPYDPPSLYKNS